MHTLGTLENFKKIVSMKPYLLHISCHGDYYVPEVKDLKEKSEGILILEQDNGIGIKTRADDLLN